MLDIKQKIMNIVNSVPDGYFNGLNSKEIVLKLMMEYTNRYGKDDDLNQINAQDTQSNTLYDFIYNLVFVALLKESDEDIENNRVMTIEESKERLMKEYEHLHL